jgi:hypothetical protein
VSRFRHHQFSCIPTSIFCLPRFPLLYPRTIEQARRSVSRSRHHQFSCIPTSIFCFYGSPGPIPARSSRTEGPCRDPGITNSPVFQLLYSASHGSPGYIPVRSSRTEGPRRDSSITNSPVFRLLYSASRVHPAIFPHDRAGPKVHVEIQASPILLCSDFYILLLRFARPYPPTIEQDRRSVSRSRHHQFSCIPTSIFCF